VKLVPVSKNPFQLEPVQGDPFKRYDTPEETAFGGTGLISAGKTFTDYATGIEQLFYEAADAVNPEWSIQKKRELSDRVQSDLKAYEKLEDADPVDAFLGSMMAEGAVGTALPGGISGGMLKRASTGALTGGVSEAAKYGSPDERIVRGEMAAGMGLGAGTLLGAANKSINAIKGVMKTDAQTQLAKQASDAGMPLTIGDATDNPLAKAVDYLLDKLPVIGTQAKRQKQLVRTRELIMKMRDDYKALGIEAPQFRGDTMGAEELGEMVGRGLDATLAKARGKAKGAYDQVQALAGEDVIPTPAMNAYVEGQILKETTNKGELADQGLIEFLKDFKGDVGANFAGLRSVRSDLGGTIRSARRGDHQNVADFKTHVVEDLKRALEQDMETWAKKKGGGVYKAWRDADRIYAEEVVPFKKRWLAVMADEGNVESVVPTLLRRNKTRMAKSVYDLTSPKGKEAIELAVIDDALEFSAVDIGGETLYSPGKFVQKMKLNNKLMGKIFTGEKMKEVQGVTNLLSHVKQAGQQIAPPTGERALAQTAPYAVGMTASTTLAPIMVLRLTMASNAGRRWVLAAGSLQPNSPGMNRLWIGMQRAARQMISSGEGSQPIQ
jgi:hypothetical protein